MFFSHYFTYGNIYVVTCYLKESLELRVEQGEMWGQKVVWWVGSSMQMLSYLGKR